jgi:hypothetical protein
VLAAIDYEIIRNAHLFIGNSVSTFSALQLLWRSTQRRALTACDSSGVARASAATAGTGPFSCLATAASSATAAGHRPSAARRAGIRLQRAAAQALDGFHYNGGNIPLRSVLFGDRPEDSHPARGLKWVRRRREQAVKSVCLTPPHPHQIKLGPRAFVRQALYCPFPCRPMPVLPWPEAARPRLHALWPGAILARTNTCLAPTQFP